MREKLRSILRRIRLSSALKAAAFAVAWLVLPFWAFFLVALYLYFVPSFQSLKLALPFFLVCFFTFTETPNVWLALFLGVLFYLIIGIKDLLFIKRKAAYEALVLLLLFVMALRFFAHFISWKDWSGFLFAFIVSAIFFFLARGFLRFGDASDNRELPPRSLEILALGAFLLWQFFIVALFLPFNFLYQTALLFVTAAILFETLFDYIARELSRRRLLLNASILFSFLVIILGSAQWSL